MPEPGPTIQPASQAKKIGLSTQTDINEEAKKRYLKHITKH